MTDKVQKIRKEVEKIFKENRERSSIEGYAAVEQLRRVLAFIDSMQEEPVSGNLEEASFDYAEACKYDGGEKLLCVEHFKAGANWKKEQFEKERLKHCDVLTTEQAQIESDFVVYHLKKHNRTPTFIDAIEYGMRLHKEQMMKDAIECEVRVDAGGYPYIPQLELWDYDEDVPLVEKSDKAKVIIIKSE